MASTALVTGAGRRIGRAIVERLVQRQCNVIVHYRSAGQEAEELVAWARKQNVKAISIQADLAQVAQVEGLFGKLKNFGPVDLLVNNASLFEEIAFEQVTAEDMIRYFNLHATAAFLLSRDFFYQLEGPGNIINMLDSRVTDKPGIDKPAYTASKSALVSLTRSLAQQFAPVARVNGLALGAILEPSSGSKVDKEKWVQDVPLKCWGSTDQVCDAIEFLVKEPGYITGEVLRIDGGRHLA